jgi:hypothetical protein
MVLPEEPFSKLPDSQLPSQDLVLALVDLVLGDRQEEQDDRANG